MLFITSTFYIFFNTLRQMEKLLKTNSSSKPQCFQIVLYATHRVVTVCRRNYTKNRLKQINLHQYFKDIMFMLLTLSHLLLFCIRLDNQNVLTSASLTTVKMLIHPKKNIILFVFINHFTLYLCKHQLAKDS